MFRSLVFGALAGVFAPLVPALSQDLSPVSQSYVLSVTAEHHRYGIWISAPDSGCVSVRYIVTAQGASLGHSRALRAGEGQLIRIRQRLATGKHVLAITSRGCAAAPGQARRVLIGKASPDHSWLQPS